MREELVRRCRSWCCLGRLPKDRRKKWRLIYIANCQNRVGSLAIDYSGRFATWYLLKVNHAKSHWKRSTRPPIEPRSPHRPPPRPVRKADQPKTPSRTLYTQPCQRAIIYLQSALQKSPTPARLSRHSSSHKPPDTRSHHFQVQGRVS